MKRYLFHILLIWLGLTARLGAQQLYYDLDRDTVRYGEQAVLRLRVSPAGQGRIHLPDSLPLAGLENVRTSPVDTMRQAGITSLMRRYYITGWDTGHYVIPPLTVRLPDTVLRTDTLRLYVADVPVDTMRAEWLVPKQPVEPAPPARKVRLRQSGKPLWPLWLLVALAAAALGYWLYRRLRKAKAQDDEHALYENLMAEWEDLYRHRDRYTDADEFYVKLTGVLRRYMERVLHIPALESVSRDIIRQLAAYRFPGGQTVDSARLEALRQMFSRADLAKFAKAAPPRALRDADLEAVKDFLQFAQGIMDEERRRQEEERQRLLAEQRRRRRRRLAVIVPAAVVVAGVALWSVWHFYGTPLRHAWERIEMKGAGIPPAAQWYDLSYGATPALHFRSPVVPLAVKLDDTLARSTQTALLGARAGRLRLAVLTAELPGQGAQARDVVALIKHLYPEFPADSLHAASGQWQQIRTGRSQWSAALWTDGPHVRLLAVETPRGSLYRKIAEQIQASAYTGKQEKQTK